MHRDSQRQKVESLLAPADIHIGGDRPWDIQVHDDRLYARLLAEGTLGVGESYMDGWWDCPAIDELVCRAVGGGLDHQFKSWRLILDVIEARVRNLQKPKRAYEIGERHYDIGNDLFRAMLDRRMNYSCGYWARADSLDEAQEHKLELIANKLELERDMRVLDVGCGWGGAARFFAERYDVEVVGITVSEKQVSLGRELCAGLPVDIRLQDYRDLDETFDRIYSIGMFEHVGYKNYPTYMQVLRRCLDKGGLFLLHTIGNNVSTPGTDPWIKRYIFPNSSLPSASQITLAAEGEFVMEDWHNFGPDYDRTLMAWHERFENAWPRLSDRYGERFRRAWRYYLLSCAGAFRARALQLWQIVFSTGTAGKAYRPAGIR
jgi:cyclopropane-fatty-acyl-phospholipid synthase